MSTPNPDSKRPTLDELKARRDGQLSYGARNCWPFSGVVPVAWLVPGYIEYGPRADAREEKKP